MALLFEEMTIGSMTARNRIVRAATAESLAAPDGGVTPRLLEVYRSLAEGGVGTVVTGYAYVTPDGKPSENAMGIYGDALVDGYRDLVAQVHGAGAKAVMQLAYGGSKSKLAPDDPRRMPPSENAHGVGANVRVLGPSAVRHPETGLVPLEATPADLERVAAAFGEAAARARSCGFDGVEVHAAHGYLLSQFLDGRYNRRVDRYGGPLENRARLALECVSAVREAAGEGFPVFVKLNSCDVLDDPTGSLGGLSEDESARVAAWLAQAGASCIEVSGDWHAASSRRADVKPQAEPYFARFGARLAAALDVPVIVTGGWRSVDVVERHLAADGIAGVGLSRPLIHDPGLPNAWNANRPRRLA